MELFYICNGFLLALNVYTAFFFLSTTMKTKPYREAFGWIGVMGVILVSSDIAFALNVGWDKLYTMNVYTVKDFIVLPFYVLELSCLLEQEEEKKARKEVGLSNPGNNIGDRVSAIDDADIVALDSEGKVWSWGGYSKEGETGPYSTTPISTPRIIQTKYDAHLEYNLQFKKVFTSDAFPLTKGYSALSLSITGVFAIATALWSFLSLIPYPSRIISTTGFLLISKPPLRSQRSQPP